MMKTSDEIREFVDETIAHVLRAPHLYVERAGEVESMLLGLDAVRRFIKGEKVPIRGYANRREQLGIPNTVSLEDHLVQRLKDEGINEPSDRQVLTAVCEFWKREIME